MIEVQNLTKYYGPVRAVHDLSFTVEKGEVVGFLGPNGAGKTTTMRVLTGYLPPTQGRASIGGYDTLTQSMEARKHIGYLPESVPLYPEMSVRGYLNFMARLRGVQDRKAAVERVMGMVSIAGRAGTLIGRLSKGYRQRVGLAQALLHNPDVLILDEPTIGLDPRQIIEVRELIKNLAGQHTVLLSTHILPEVEQICTRVLIINKGQIVAEDAPGMLATRLRHAESITVQVTGCDGELAPALMSLPNVQSVIPAGQDRYEVRTTAGQDLRAQIAATIVGKGWSLLELRTTSMSLEDIFLQLTQEEPTDDQSISQSVNQSAGEESTSDQSTRDHPSGESATSNE
jgi:ABC-2 type transport system ATP-binding protein